MERLKKGGRVMGAIGGTWISEGRAVTWHT